MPRVLAITVGWNCRDCILAGVAALQAQVGARCDVLVVDNASTDGTAAAVRERHPDVEVASLPYNKGGAGGFAHGMALARDSGYDFVWLLDGDARAAPDALVAFLTEEPRYPRAAAFAATILRDDGSGLIQECGGTLDAITGRPRFLAAGEPAATPRVGRTVDYGAACSLFVRVDAIHSIGTFDPRLFVFFDDVDWCLRATTVGWEIRTCPASRAWHPWHAAKKAAPWRVYYGARNQILVLGARTPAWRGACDRWLWSWWACRWSRRWQAAGQPLLAAAVLQGVRDAWHHPDTWQAPTSSLSAEMPVTPPRRRDSFLALVDTLRWACRS